MTCPPTPRGESAARPVAGDAGAPAANGTVPEIAAPTPSPWDARSLAAAADGLRLASLFLFLPTPEMARSVLDGTLVQDTRDILDELGVSEQEAAKALAILGARQTDAPDDGVPDEATLHTALRRTYTRMFTHPVHPQIALYETLFRYELQPGRAAIAPSPFTSPVAHDAQRAYRSVGFSRTAPSNEPFDHMGTELEFAASLLATLAQADPESPDAETARTILRAFLRDHLNGWAPAFASRMRAAAVTSEDNPGLQGMANRTYAFVGALFELVYQTVQGL